MNIEDFPSSHFLYMKLNDYLKHLPGEGFFYFKKEDNQIYYLIDNPEWGSFFGSKETM